MVPVSRLTLALSLAAALTAGIVMATVVVLDRPKEAVP